LPVLAIVIDCGALVVPIAWAANVNDVGVNVTADGAGAGVGVGGAGSGVAVGGGGVGGGFGVDGVHPSSVACAEVVPSETVTWQVAELKG
jgi:hypothetical protein